MTGVGAGNECDYPLRLK